MTAEEALKRELVSRYIELYKDDEDVNTDLDFSCDIDDLYDSCANIFDLESDLRSGEVETDIEPPFNRHYESRSVAMKTEKYGWIGWTYWFGGGKHGCPEEIDWIGDAYFLDCEEKEVMTTVRTFKKGYVKRLGVAEFKISN